MKNIKESIKKFLYFFNKFVLLCVPSYKDISFFVLASSILGLVLLFGYIFISFVPKVYASDSKIVDSVPDSVFDYMTFQVSGCVGLLNFATVSNTEFSPLTQSTGIGRTAYNRCLTSLQASKATSAQFGPSFALMDFGATGSVINATATLYQEPIAQPGEAIGYYASRIRGDVFAEDNPISGRSVLAPVQILNNNMVNLAYGLIVILLLTSSFNLLISNLTGADTKLTMVQLIINSVVTLVMVSAYYEISAVIYDITVNYANALVAGFLSPFINSIVILERLSPGGDISIVNILNAYQFVGITDGFLVVITSIAQSIFPLLNQSAVAVGNAVFGGNLDGNALGFLAGQLASFFGGIGGVAAGGVVTSILGSSQIFTAIIAWIIFLLNLKIFFNLIVAYVTFTLLVGFGPLIALGGIEGGFDSIKESFKKLVSLGLVFPVTFFFILMAGIMFNIFIPVGQQSGASKIELCRFSKDDPAVSKGVVDNWGVWWLFNYDNPFLPGFSGTPAERYNPMDFRMRNTINQNIINVTPATIVEEDGVRYRNCRPALFPTPWTFVPAPFGSIGQRDLQVQTIDAFIRTILGVVFIVLASRTPDILRETLGVKDLSSLNGIQSIFSEGFQKTFSVGAQGLAGGFAAGVLGVGVHKLLSQNVPVYNKFTNAIGSRLGLSRPRAQNIDRMLSEIKSKYNGSNLDPGIIDELALEELKKKLFEIPGAGISQGQFIYTELTSIGKSLQNFGSALNAVTAQMENVASRLSSIATQLDILGK